MIYLIMIDGHPLKRNGHIKCYKTVEQARKYAKEERYWQTEAKIEVAQLSTTTIEEIE
ncbi:hypothetical protein [Paenibacillus sp. OV219]|uniref:hypothetical protein n=1 Tax=Paenibacillus sp. OV219 TaxID=1884377 RepID=UPI0008BC7AED|nr:hypothetical protein [Paenibacillus sp. OV219]SEN20750.1 hypothetical protein SAMN05518847_102414 [Paenibacillus sp. OV219]